MSARWLTHFGLEASPFSKEIIDGDLWVPASRKPVVDDLVETCEEHGHALLTGEPWPYDAVAGTDSELLVLDKEMFQLLLERKPDLAQRLSERVAEVQHRDRNAFRGLQKTAEETPHNEENLLTKISDFFELV